MTEAASRENRASRRRTMAPSHEQSRPANRVGGRASSVFPGRACRVTPGQTPRGPQNRGLCIIQSQALSTPSYDAASVRLLKPSTAVTLMEVEKTSVFAPSPSHLISASPHHLCPGSMTTPTFLLARGAGDAALDRAG